MRRRWGLLALVLAVIVAAGASIVPAQIDPRSLSSHSSLLSNSTTGKDANARWSLTLISVQFAGVPLEKALKQIADYFSLRLWYSDAVVPVQRKVTVALKDATLSDAMSAVLYGTDLEFMVSEHAQLVLAAKERIEQETGTISGKVVDSKTREPLPGANVVIAGTAIGGSTNIDGIYRIARVPAGTYDLVVSYIGYKRVTLPVVVQPGRVIQIDVELDFEALELKEVIVTALLEGQSRAINQQITSNTIVNVVSADKIRELPDQNAAEALARLPGISIQRDAGEGQKVVVRGLSPKFNSITVNDERIPSTDAIDRSVDLSMISPDMLAGIEVYKALTPDRDADAIGGTVNFVIRKAPSDLHGNVRFEGGYNQLQNEYHQYKTSISLSDRLFDGKLGAMLTGNLQRANRSSDVLNASYGFSREKIGEEEVAKVRVSSLNLADRIEIRKRYGGSITLDYEFDQGTLLYSSFYSRTDRDEIRRHKSYNVGSFLTTYQLRDQEINTQLWTNSLSGQLDLGGIQTTWRGSLSQTRQHTPFSHVSLFQELAPFLPSLVEDQGPEWIPLGAKNNLDETFFKEDYLYEDLVKDRDYTGSVDFKIPFNVGVDVAGYMKLGAKFRGKKRERDHECWWTDSFGIDAFGKDDITGQWQLTVDKKLKIINFIDPDFTAKNFLNGRYSFGPGLSVDGLNNFLRTYRDYRYTKQVGFYPAGKALYVVDPLIDLDDYRAGERITAGYLMMELNLGKRLMILPGVRYEHTYNDYFSIFGTPIMADDERQGIVALSDSTGQRKYAELLPMVQVRYNLASWCDLRAAVTRTLSRPDYVNLVPWERINQSSRTVERGNPNLKPTKSWNYDIFLSFYGSFGLFTVGGFYKEVQDIDYLRRNRILASGSLQGYDLTQPVNAEDICVVKGLEVELQTNLKFLPSPLDGFVIYANYSRIYSKTIFPYFDIGPRSPLPPFTPIIIDTVRTGRMPGQADHIANLSIGYEKSGFTGRVSMVYQGESLTFVGQRAELDGFSKAFVRWDLTMQQKVWEGLSLILSINNLTNRPETSSLGIRTYPTNDEYFGWTADIGVRYNF